MAVASILKAKAKKEMRPVLSLVQILGISTIFFGVVSGTVFGINLIDSGYTITEKNIVYLQKDGVPTDVVQQIEPLKGKHFEKKDDFTAALKQVADSSSLAKYGPLFIKNTESDIQIIQKFRHLMQDPSAMFNWALVVGIIQIVLE
ncbi:MAG: hypothetical protein HC896_17735 [Bacteroidales bacterium]|nr:hypothetical protein [Bacteroidales bacterium]